MSRRRLRFIHSSDWHLDCPVGGLVDVPERLKPILVDAPYQAAERVVNTALAEQVDFVVLAGDVLDVELAGPRGAAFLIRQFERLAERHIAVYWPGGRIDRPECWPAALCLPDNVHRFSSRRPEEFIVLIDEEPLARVTGMNRPRGGKIRAADFWPDGDKLPTIAVTSGRAKNDALAARGLTYWALGGRHARLALCESPYAAGYSGSPQARQPAETGAYGCTVVEIDDDRHVQTRSVATDVLRFCRRRLNVTPSTTVNELQDKLSEQTRELRNAGPDLHWLVSWSIAGSGQLVTDLRRGPIVRELLSRLTMDSEPQTPIVWSMSFEVEPEAAVPPAWLEQDSLLGDYLRAMAEFDGQGACDPADLIGPLDDMAGQTQHAVAARRLMRLGEEERRQMLQLAASVGADLLLPGGLGRPSLAELLR